MTIKCELTMLTFTKTKNTRLPDSVHNAGVTLQSRDIPHTLPSPIFYERAPVIAMQLRTFTRFHWIIHYHVIHELYCLYYFQHFQVVIFCPFYLK
jgi:hypothetical protein